MDAPQIVNFGVGPLWVILCLDSFCNCFVSVNHNFWTFYCSLSFGSICNLAFSSTGFCFRGRIQSYKRGARWSLVIYHVDPSTVIFCLFFTGAASISRSNCRKIRHAQLYFVYITFLEDLITT